MAGSDPILETFNGCPNHQTETVILLSVHIVTLLNIVPYNL